ncbi:hypothetical protein ACJX0J_036162 [Zea mays]
MYVFLLFYHNIILIISILIFPFSFFLITIHTLPSSGTLIKNILSVNDKIHYTCVLLNFVLIANIYFYPVIFLFCDGGILLMKMAADKKRNLGAGLYHLSPDDLNKTIVASNLKQKNGVLREVLKIETQLCRSGVLRKLLRHNSRATDQLATTTSIDTYL